MSICKNRSRGNCRENAQMGRFFRSLKAEWVPDTGYHSFAVAKYSVIHYIMGYYSQVRLHSATDGPIHNESEKKYWLEYYIVAKNT